MLGVLLAGLLSACGTPAGTSPSIPPPPSPDPFISALIMTKTWAASEIETEVTSTVDGVQRDLSGTGTVAIDKGYADFQWTEGDDHFRELVNDRAIFTLPDSADVWVRTETGGRTATSAFADPLLNLTRLQEVVQDGTEKMDGFTAERFRGSLPVTAANLEGLALTDEEITRIVAAAGRDDSVTVTAWADPNHRLVRIDRALDLQSESVDASAVASSHLTNFGVMLDLKAPPSASVTAQQS